MHVDESDEAGRIQKVCVQANEMMNGDAVATSIWLNSSLLILGNKSPLEHAKTESGAREVEDLIGRLRHGVFS